MHLPQSVCYATPRTPSSSPAPWKDLNNAHVGRYIRRSARAGPRNEYSTSSMQPAESDRQTYIRSSAQSTASSPSQSSAVIILTLTTHPLCQLTQSPHALPTAHQLPPACMHASKTPCPGPSSMGLTSLDRPRTSHITHHTPGRITAQFQAYYDREQGWEEEEGWDNRCLVPRTRVKTRMLRTVPYRTVP